MIIFFFQPSLVSESGLSNSDGFLFSFKIIRILCLIFFFLGKKQKKYSMIVVDDSGRESNSLELSDEERSREVAVKRYFEQKLAQLTSQVGFFYV